MPEHVGPAIEQVLAAILPEPLAEFRVLILKEHADAVLRLRDHFREVCRRRLLDIAGELTDQGYSNTTAAQLAVFRFGPERQMIEQQKEELLDRLTDQVRLKMAKLCEWWVRTEWNPKKDENPTP